MSSGSMSPFQPNTTVVLSASSVSTNLQLPAKGETMLVTNLAASPAYVRFGADSSLQATSSDTPVLPNSRILLRCGPLVSYCAAILISGSGSVLFTRGDGSTI